MAELTPWEKIMRAARTNSGLRLTPNEAFQLSRDGAIATRAEMDTQEREEASGEVNERQ